MDPFLGSWILEKSENFDEYLNKQGVPWPVRQAVKLMKPSRSFEKGGEDGVFLSKSDSPKDRTWTFRLGESFETNAAEEVGPLAKIMPESLLIKKVTYRLRDDGALEEIHERMDGIIDNCWFSFEEDLLVFHLDAGDGLVAKRYFKRKS